jgi:hypothetical protein
MRASDREGVAMPLVAGVVAVLLVVFAYAFLTLGSPATTSTGFSSSSSSQGFAYLEAVGGCTAGGATAPCWGGNQSTAYVFACLSQAEDQGCTRVVDVTPPGGSFTVDIAYQPDNATAPSWANCYWELKSAPVVENGWGYCSPDGADSFVVWTLDAPPQTVG